MSERAKEIVRGMGVSECVRACVCVLVLCVSGSGFESVRAGVIGVHVYV